MKRKNVMYNGEPGQNNPDTSSAVGSSKAFTVKIKSTTALPSCLNTCNPAFPLVASDKAPRCFANRAFVFKRSVTSESASGTK